MLPRRGRAGHACAEAATRHAPSSSPCPPGQPGGISHRGRLWGRVADAVDNAQRVRAAVNLAVRAAQKSAHPGPGGSKPGVNSPARKQQPLQPVRQLDIDLADELIPQPSRHRLPHRHDHAGKAVPRRPTRAGRPRPLWGRGGGRGLRCPSRSGSLVRPSGGEPGWGWCGAAWGGRRCGWCRRPGRSGRPIPGAASRARSIGRRAGRSSGSRCVRRRGGGAGPQRAYRPACPPRRTMRRRHARYGAATRPGQPGRGRCRRRRGYQPEAVLVDRDGVEHLLGPGTSGSSCSAMARYFA